jgi:hypothetical protein
VFKEEEPCFKSLHSFCPCSPHPASCPPLLNSRLPGLTLFYKTRLGSLLPKVCILAASFARSPHSCHLLWEAYLNHPSVKELKNNTCHMSTMCQPLSEALRMSDLIQSSWTQEPSQVDPVLISTFLGREMGPQRFCNLPEIIEEVAELRCKPAFWPWNPCPSSPVFID